MDKTEQIIYYLYNSYPVCRKEWLSKSRIKYLLYLIDWESCLRIGKQLTYFDWYVSCYGADNEQYEKAIINSGILGFKDIKTFYGDFKQVLIVKNDPKQELTISNEEKDIIRTIISKSEGLFFNELINMINHTYPMQNVNRFGILDLESSVKELKQKIENETNKNT